MKNLLLLLLINLSLLAESLPEVGPSFSKTAQTKLFTLIQKQTLVMNQTLLYKIHKGWNSFRSGKDGIDVIKTFKDLPSVKFVVTYDLKSNYWAGFTLKQELLKDIKEMLLLRSLEPNIHFFLLSDKDMELRVSTQEPSGQCLLLRDDSRFQSLQSSGLDIKPAEKRKDIISIKSRYHSHEYRGYYDDTRVILFYPKINLKNKKRAHYGPAEPLVYLDYAKEYEDKTFYIYDYLMQKCYQGVFPSKKMPPFPALQILE